MRVVQNPGYSSLLILLLFLIGCASIWPKPEKELYTSPVVIGNKVTLHIPQGLSDQEKTLLISAATTQLDVFEQDWGSGTRPVHVWFSKGNGESIPCGNLDGTFWGCHYGKDGPIHVWLDPYFTSIVLYHELVHHNMDDNDHEHKDPRWKSRWEPRQVELIKKLRSKHKRILGHRGGR